MPLNTEHEFSGNWLYFFNPFGILIAVTTLALFMLHGAIYLGMKTENRLYAKLIILAKNFTIFFVISFALSTFYTLLYIPHLSDEIKSHPVLFILPLIMTLAIANIPRCLKKRNFRVAFLSSSLTIAALLMLVAIEVFPYLVYSPQFPANSITVQNAAASHKTMGILLTIALIGTPLVLLYTSFVFWTFKGKVKLDEMSL
jgi:cytochrome d ubiquinol oxidase subunit II